MRAHNTGAAFSFLADASGWQRWFFIGLGIAAAVFIVWLLRAPRRPAHVLLGAGADPRRRARQRRSTGILHGHVVDFIQVHWGTHYFPSFNVADSAITIGAVLLILDELLPRPHGALTARQLVRAQRAAEGLGPPDLHRAVPDASAIGGAHLGEVGAT